MTELIICTTCRPNGTARELPAAGQALFDAVLRAAAESAAADASPGEGLRIVGIACLSGCSRACVVALQAPGKHSYCFAELTPDAETAEQVLTCARQHQHSRDGLLPWKDRPEQLRAGLLVRLPPFNADSAAAASLVV